MSFIDILMIVFPVVVVSILTWDRAIVGKMPILCAVSHAFNTIIVLCLRYTMQLVGCLISWFWYIDLKVIDWVVGTEYAPLTSCVSRNGKKVVVTSDPEFVKRALRMGRKSCIRDEVGPLKEKVSHIEEKSGELFSEDEWRMALDAARTTFDEKNIRGFIEKSAVFHKRYINGLIEVVSQGKREFHLYNFLCAASFDSMMHAVYGMDWRTIDDDDRHLFDRFAFFQAPHELLSARTLRHHLIDGPGCDMFKLDRPDATEALEKIGFTVINRLQSEKESIPRNGTCPFLKNYINRPQYYKNRDDGMGATMSTLIVLAGTDAMAFALYVTLYLLARNPDKQTIMRHEVTRVLADKKELTFEDLKELEYVEAVILESLRLFPPKGTLTRYATKSNVCGISLEDGDLIEINIRKMNSTHENFTNPLDFLPERFTDTRIRRERKHQNLLTFGSDPCLGKDFAMNIMKHFLASFVLSLKVERVARTPTLFCLPENRVTSDHFSRRESFDKNPLHIGLSLTNPDGAEC